VSLPERSKWALSRTAFDRLLESLAADRERAGEAYEHLRKRLVKFFSWERCAEPESCADETLNRIARSLERGTAIQKMEHYALAVARLVMLEARTRERNLSSVLSDPAAMPTFNEEAERALACLENCLNALPADQRTFLLEYYRGGGSARIANRRRMAEASGIDRNALRNRAMRLRERVESCVRSCLQRGSL
jgi:DNA-directed RNA polymerase specialized sigma24 family protein